MKTCGARARGLLRSGGAARMRSVLRVMVVLMLLAARPAWAQPAAVIRESSEPGPGRIIYGGDENFRPNEWSDDAGRPVGFQIDLIRAIGRAAGVPVEVRLGPWSEIRESLLAGEVDVVGLFDQPARHSYADFSAPHSVQASTIFIRKGTTPIDRLDQLAGRSVIVQRDALAEEQIRAAAIPASLILVNNEAEAILLLASGSHDCAVVTQAGGHDAIARFRLSNITTSGPPILASNVCFAVRKGNPEMLRLVDRGLATVKASGEYSAIFQKWFGEVGRGGISRARAAAWAGAIVAPVAALALAALIWSRSLRRRVEQRTAEIAKQLAERRKAEEALRASEDRFRAVLRASGITVCTQDSDLKFTWLYDPGRVLGPGGLVGLRDPDVLPADAAAPLMSAKHRVLRTGEGARRELLLHRDNQDRWYEVAIEPLPGSDGRPGGVMSAIVDVTQLKRAEARRFELERRIMQAQKLESLGLLAAGVGHDFNNLLTGILGYADQARRAVGAAAEEPIRGIELLARRAGELTQQLLALTGGGKMLVSSVDLAGVADEMCRLLRASLGPKVQLEFQPGPAIPEIEADATQIRQVVLNLVKNAADAIGDSPGRIIVRAVRAELTEHDLRAARIGGDALPGPYVGLVVGDDGPGIDPVVLGRIFDSFFTTKPQGRGLGLAVVAGVVQRHRGVVIIDHGPSGGSTFRIYFPLASTLEGVLERAVSASSIPYAPARPGQRGAVLIVDDMRAVREFLTESLTEAGYHAIPAADAAEAMRLFGEFRSSIRAILLDVGLPGTSGLRLLDHVRAEHSSVPVLLITGMVEVEDAALYANDPRVALLRKPFSTSELLLIVETLCRVGVDGPAPRPSGALH
ncbi:MAG: transporter substrate-binding domain-containing protein [Phycisphaerales bacterium]|nr:transporter substrate-binding domain-containing protein [Phycisphaerales bacterium]